MRIGRWDLASCQVQLNSIKQFQRRSWKCFMQSEAVWPFFLDWPKTQTWKRKLRSCFLSIFLEFCSAVSKEKSKISQPVRGRFAILFNLSARKHKLSRGRRDNAPCQVSQKSKMSESFRGGAVILFFPIGPKTQIWKRMLRSCFLSSFVETPAMGDMKLKTSFPYQSLLCVHGVHSFHIFWYGDYTTQTTWLRYT